MDLANLKEDRNKIFAKWKSEKDVVDNIQAIKTKLKISSMKQNVQNARDYGKVAENSLWKNKPKNV
jgi:ATP-dependent Clp protease ATP-binding subunit ClpB